MADRNPLVQQLEDRNTAYAVMRAIEHHGGPSVLVCDPATRASVAVIFPIAEWDAIAKIHNETVDDLEALESASAIRYVGPPEADLTELAGKSLASLTDEEFAAAAAEHIGITENAGWAKALLDQDLLDKKIKDNEDFIASGIQIVDETGRVTALHHGSSKDDLARARAAAGLTTIFASADDDVEIDSPPEGPKAVERKNLQRRVREQRKQLDMLTEQAKGRKKEISYWKAVSQANLDTLNHYGIKPPKIKAVRPEGSDEPEFQAVGGYL